MQEPVERWGRFWKLFVVPYLSWFSRKWAKAGEERILGKTFDFPLSLSHHADKKSRILNQKYHWDSDTLFAASNCERQSFTSLLGHPSETSLCKGFNSETGRKQAKISWLSGDLSKGPMWDVPSPIEPMGDAREFPWNRAKEKHYHLCYIISNIPSQILFKHHNHISISIISKPGTNTW